VAKKSAETSQARTDKSLPASETRTGRKTSTAAKFPADAENTVTADRGDESNRRQGDRRNAQMPVTTERRKVQRRRQIDPTTCERDYSNEEVEFMHAIDLFKRTTGRNFPTCQDVLEVIQGMGYQKVEKA
jgi:hypothetical protein